MTITSEDIETADLKDYTFTLNGGLSMVKGKGNYPVLVRLRFLKKDALILAMDVLRRLENSSEIGVDDFLLELPLFGSLDLVESSS